LPVIILVATNHPSLRLDITTGIGAITCVIHHVRLYLRKLYVASEDTCICSYKNYSSLLGGKLIVFTFYNYGFVLAKVRQVFLRLFHLILLFMRLILLFVSFVKILDL
jgi:hypothetical protein